MVNGMNAVSMPARFAGPRTEGSRFVESHIPASTSSFIGTSNSCHLEIPASCLILCTVPGTGLIKPVSPRDPSDPGFVSVLS